MKLALITAHLAQSAFAVLDNKDRAFHRALAALSHPIEEATVPAIHIYDDFHDLFYGSPSPHSGSAGAGEDDEEAPSHYSGAAYYPPGILEEDEPRDPV